jgi:sporulation protein YlmC with PRC-barrel domain
MQQDKIKKTDPENKFRRVLAASTLTGNRVRNFPGDDLGTIDEIMLDIPSGRIAYAVLSFGGVLGIGGKLFAVPWNALAVDEDDKCFTLDVDKTKLENAPGFDKDNWPDMTDHGWGSKIFNYYGVEPYWETPDGKTVHSERMEPGKTVRSGGGM